MSDIGCSFCYKPRGEVHILLCGKSGDKDVFICNLCVDLMHEFDELIEMPKESEIYAHYREQRTAQEAERTELLRVVERLCVVVTRDQFRLASDGPCLVCGKADHTTVDDTHYEHAHDCALIVARGIIRRADKKSEIK